MNAKEKLKQILRAELEYLLDFDEEKVTIIENFRYKLSPRGFEIYVKYFFERFEGYTLTLGGNGKTYEADGGIDLYGTHKERHTKIIIQCKKRVTRDIKISDLYQFYGAIRDNISPTDRLYYITSAHHITPQAKKFADERNIKITDHNNLLKMHKLFSIQDFRSLIVNDTKYSIDEIFQLEQLAIPFNINNAIIEENIKNYLSIVRYIISRDYGVKKYSICSDATLKEIAKIRPKNLRVLERLLANSEKFAIPFLKALQYIE